MPYAPTKKPVPDTDEAPKYGYTRARLEQALQKAHAASQRGEKGAFEAALQIAEDIRERRYDEVVPGLKSFAQGFSQGATIGTGEEISAAVRALTENFTDPTFRMIGHMAGNIEPGDEGKNPFDVWKAREEMFFPGGYFSGMGKRYDQALASNRAQLAASRAEDPMTTFAGELTAGLGMGAAGGTKAVAGKSLTEGAKALAKTGFMYGAGGAYGYSEGDPIRAITTGDRDEMRAEAVEALKDMAVGGGAGLVGGYTTPFIGAGARALGRFVYGLSPGGKRVMFNEQAKQALIDAYKADVAGGYITPQKALKELSEVPDLVVGDLGPSLRDEMMRIGQMNTVGGSGIRQFVIDRNKKQFNRIYPKLARALSGEADPNFGILQRDMLAEKQRAAAAMYGAIGDVPANMDGSMRTILQNPQVKQALKHANRIRQIEGKPPLDIDNIGAERLSTDEMHSVLEGLRSVTDQLYKTGKGKIATKYKENLYKPFRDRAYQLNEDLAEAQKVWRDNSAIEEAMEMGEKIFRDDYEATELMLEGFSDAEQLAHRMGILKAFRNAMDTKSFDADLLKAVTNSRKKEKMLELAFGDKGQFEEFMNYLVTEDKMFQTMKDATSNSLTARRLLQQDPDVGKRFATQFGYNIGLGRQNQQPVGMGPRLSAFLAETAQEMVNPEASRLARMQQQSDMQAQMLLSKDLKNVITPHTIGGLLDTGVPTTPAVAVPGLLSTGGLHEDYGY